MKRQLSYSLIMFFVYHGAFEDIISNHGPQFASKFQKQLFELLNVKVKLS